MNAFALIGATPLATMLIVWAVAVALLAAVAVLLNRTPKSTRDPELRGWHARYRTGLERLERIR